MAIKERRQRENEEMRELILSASGGIIAEEGIENLSIRRLAARIEYSPAVIYHYFKDKDDIINNLMKKGYGDIVGVISSVQGGEPMQRLEEMTRKYIAKALEMPDIYRTVLLSGSPEVLAHTSALFKGAGENRQAIGILCRCLGEIRSDGEIDGEAAELAAQIIWTSTFGLIIRLILEKELPQVQKDSLISQHIRMIKNAAVACR
jgi:AcrR family transcriptional regulator